MYVLFSDINVSASILLTEWKMLFFFPNGCETSPSLTQTGPITLNTSVSRNCSKMCQATSNLSPVRNKSQALTSSSQPLENTPTCQLPEAVVPLSLFCICVNRERFLVSNNCFRKPI